MGKEIIKIENEIEPLNVCKVTKTSLEIKSGATFEEWDKIGHTLKTFYRANKWWIGDWLNFGERKYGETFSQALDETDFEYHTLQNYKYVANRIEMSRRRDNLSFSHHSEVASLEPKEQEKWLAMAEKEGWDRAEMRRQIRDRNRKEIPLPEGKYQVIYADIPWAYDVDLSKGATRSPENNYPVMDLEEIKNFGLRVRELATDDCVLFMWITAPKLNWMGEVLEAFGFEYKTNLIWDKVKPNLGHYSSVRHEILVIAGKGNCAPICDGKTIQSIDSVQSIEKSSRHSEKPLEFMDIIDKLYPDYKKIELFARNKDKRRNWSYWGDQANV